MFGTDLRPSPCAVSERCGGCPLIQLEETRQHALKTAGLLERLRQHGLDIPERVTFQTGRALGYRNRLRIKIEEDGAVRFFNPEKLHDCSVLEPALAAAINEVVACAARQPRAFQPYAHAEIRTLDLDGNYAALLTARPPPRVSGAATDSCLGITTRSALPALGSNWLVDSANTAPESMLRQRFALTSSTWYYVPINAFMQVNTQINSDLVASVCAGVRARSLKSFADLFCGSGNFSLPLAASGLAGTAVEINAAASLALCAAASEQGLTGLRIIQGDAIREAHAFSAEGREFELVLADPPRAGLKESVHNIAKLAGRFIALCSCNSETLAKDLAILSDLGFVLEELQLFDMFPQTRHLEVLAWLKRV